MLILKPRPGRPLGVYVHFPFCRRRCPYCAFPVAIRRTPPFEAYTRALVDEFRRRLPDFAGRRLVSIYLGGGTPSLVPPRLLAQVINLVRSSFPRDAPERPLEITIEVNPEDATREDLDQWRELGINRLSLGAQSFDRAALAALGRTHGAEQAITLVETASQSGWTTVGLDLIIGGPDRSSASVRDDIERICGLGAMLHHVSLYTLGVERQTVFGRRQRRGRLALSEEAEVVEQLQWATHRLKAAGLHRYEVANYARPGHACRHNLLYWQGGETMGLGMGASEFRIDAGQGIAIRAANAPSLRTYLEDSRRDRFVEILPPAKHLGERLWLGLRTGMGVARHELEAQFGPGAFACIAPGLEIALGKGWIAVEEGERYRPTERGLLFSDALGALFLTSVG